MKFVSLERVNAKIFATLLKPVFFMFFPSIVIAAELPPSNCSASQAPTLDNITAHSSKDSPAVPKKFPGVNSKYKVVPSLLTPAANRESKDKAGKSIISPCFKMV